jgi:hypothetical protein
MNDTRAQAAIDAYREIIRRYRNPSIAPELTRITRDLYYAAEYFDSLEDLTKEQSQLLTEINGLLMRD